MLQIKKKVFLLMMILSCMLMVSCRSKHEEIEEYRELHFRRLKSLGVLYDEQYMQYDELSKPRLSYSVYYPESDKKVSLYELNYIIYIYNLLEPEDIESTAEDMVNLYYTMDADKTEEMECLYEWYIGLNVANVEYSGEDKTQIIGTAVVQVYSILYPEKVGENYLATENTSELDLEERIAFVEWILDNPDYEFAAEYDEYYKFLDWMGLIPETEKREVSGKFEELYGKEIYVAD